MKNIILSIYKIGLSDEKRYKCRNFDKACIMYRNIYCFFLSYSIMTSYEIYYMFMGGIINKKSLDLIIKNRSRLVIF